MGKENGFTIFETLVATAIMVLIGSMIFANYSGAGDRFVTRGAAEEIASSIRQVQAYGLAVKEFGLTEPGAFPGYGIYFRLNIPNAYVIFADSNGNFAYDPPGETVATTTLQSGVTIYDLCANEKTVGETPTCAPTSLTGVYLRPNPTVTLKGGSPTCTGYGATWCDIEVKIKGKRGTTKTIVLWRSGQVSVE